MKPALAAALALALLAGGAGRSVAASPAGAAGYRILLVSDRDGVRRVYSMRPDGSRLTPLLPRGRAPAPAGLSRDGSTIGYIDRDARHPTGFYVSRADGTGLHRVVGGSAGGVLSADGRLLAFSTKRPGIWIVGTNGRGLRRLTRRLDDPAGWSPDGRALAFVHYVGDYAGVLVVRPLHGTGHVLTWGEFDGIAWAPDGRWIAYADDAGSLRTSLWVVRPNGRSRHRIARDIGSFSWSPDGKSLAYTNASDVVVVGLDGRGRRLGLSDHDVSSVTWLPDGRLALTTRYPEQISIVDRNGHGLRRLTRAGSNAVLGWTRLVPVLPPARPVAPTERVVGPRRLDVRAKIGAIAADGARIALITGPTPTDCDHVAVWTPSERSVRRPVPAPCGQPHEYVDSLGPVALAGTRLAWGSEGCCGNNDYTNVVTTTLAHPDAPWPYAAEAAVSRGSSGGTLADGPVGHGSLMVFAIQWFCDSYASPGEEDACPPGFTGPGAVDTTVWRLGGGGRCPGEGRPVGGCSLMAKIDGTATVLAVDSGRIVVGTSTGVEVLTAGGGVLRTFPATPKAAALSGARLAVETDEGIDVYDMASGRRTARFPDATDLQDLEGDILVTAPSEGIMLRRLGTGRSTTIAGGTGVSAQLERPGLFVAGQHWITFTPMREIRRQLGA
jgi:Tol biopolymer transport system component